MTSLHYGHRLRGAWPRSLHDEDLRLEKQHNVPESLTPRLYTVGDAVNNGRLITRQNRSKNAPDDTIHLRNLLHLFFRQHYPSQLRSRQTTEGTNGPVLSDPGFRHHAFLCEGLYKGTRPQEVHDFFSPRFFQSWPFQSSVGDTSA